MSNICLARIVSLKSVIRKGRFQFKGKSLYSSIVIALGLGCDISTPHLRLFKKSMESMEICYLQIETSPVPTTGFGPHNTARAQPGCNNVPFVILLSEIWLKIFILNLCISKYFINISYYKLPQR